MGKVSVHVRVLVLVAVRVTGGIAVGSTAKVGARLDDRVRVLRVSSSTCR